MKNYDNEPEALTKKLESLATRANKCGDLKWERYEYAIWIEDYKFQIGTIDPHRSYDVFFSRGQWLCPEYPELEKYLNRLQTVEACEDWAIEFLEERGYIINHPAIC